MQNHFSLLFLIAFTFILSGCTGSGTPSLAGPSTPNSANTSAPNSSPNDVVSVAAVENPAVTLAITPAKGSLGGGYSILLVGTGFTPGTTVKVGGSSCTSLQILSLSQISCKVPAHAIAETVEIVTKTASGIASTFPAAFTYATDAFSTLNLIAGALDPSGSANGAGSVARFSNPRGIVSDGTNLYVIDQANQVIRAIQISTGQVSILAGTLGVAGNMDAIGQVARFYNPQYIAIDPAKQNLYVTDGQHTIRQINLTTQQVTTIAGLYGTVGTADGMGAAARFKNPYGIVAASNTLLYIADGSNYTIRQIDLANSNNVTTLAGVAGTAGATEGNGVGGPAPLALFSTPAGITLVGTTLYVADYGNNRIRQVDLSVSPPVVSTLAGSVAGLMDGMGTLARFAGPNDVFASNGFVYVMDYRNAVVRKVNIQAGPTLGMVSSIAGSFPQALVGSSDGVGAMARFSGAQCLTVVGNAIYVSDGNQSIRKVDIPTATVSTFAGVTVPSGYRDGAGLQSLFITPKGGALYNGNLYVTDSGNYVIRAIDIASGAVSTIAGTPLVAGSADGVEFMGRFSSPYGITADPATGNLYVSELNHVIRQVNPSTGSVSTILGTPGTAGTADGIGTGAQFNQPYGLVFGNGSLYIADTANHAIRAVNLQTMAVTTLAGLAGSPAGVDGVGNVARFNNPRGIVIDPAGQNLYISDYGNQAIRKINIATGTVTTFAGVLGAAAYSDGVGNTARFYYPWTMTSDGSNLYVYDNTYCLVRKVNLATAGVTTLVGNPSAVACNDIDGTLDIARTAHPLGMLWSNQGMFLFGNNGVRVLK